MQCTIQNYSNHTISALSDELFSHGQVCDHEYSLNLQLNMPTDVYTETQALYSKYASCNNSEAPTVQVADKSKHKQLYIWIRDNKQLFYTLHIIIQDFDFTPAILGLGSTWQLTSSSLYLPKFL